MISNIQKKKISSVYFFFSHDPGRERYNDIIPKPQKDMWCRSNEIAGQKTKFQRNVYDWYMVSNVCQNILFWFSSIYIFTLFEFQVLYFLKSLFNFNFPLDFAILFRQFWFSSLFFLWWCLFYTTIPINI